MFLRNAFEIFPDEFSEIPENLKIYKISPRKISGKFTKLHRGVFSVNTMTQSEKLSFYYCKTQEKQGKLWRNFGEISEIPKIREKFSGEISPENSRKTRGVFSVNTMLQLENHYFYFYKRE